MSELLALFGPTGVGKTDVALALADALRAEGADPVAISADALQVYEGLPLLTGAASPTERKRLEHRLVGFVDVGESFSVGDFMPLAHAEIDGALAAGRPPIVVGGTGLYLRAALTRLDLGPKPPAELRAALQRELEAEGPAALHQRLSRLAPEQAERIDPGDRSRIVRALELYEMGGLAPPPATSQLWTADVRVPTVLTGLVMDREALYSRIDARVERMVASGAVEEVRRADSAGASHTARQALGFGELLRGDVEAMKRRTRNYARRQLTWMRKLPTDLTIDVTGRSPADVATEILARRRAA